MLTAAVSISCLPFAVTAAHASRISTRTSRLDLPPVDQRRPVGHDLLDRRPAAGEPGDAGRAGEHQRRDLAGEALDRRLLPGAHADPELHLGQVGIGRPAEPAVGGVDADELGEDLLELEAQVREPLRGGPGRPRCALSYASGQA